jgi:hypothetical protein
LGVFYKYGYTEITTFRDPCNILNKPSTSPLSTIDIIIKITFDTPQAGRWTPTHKELETSDSQQGRISSAATHIPSKQRSYLF